MPAKKALKNERGGGMKDMTEQQKMQQAAAAKNAALKPLPLPKRFYQTVSTAPVPAEAAAGENGGQAAAYAVLLDGRPVKTPARNALLLPSESLAALIADEFRRQQQVINPALMPITRLANTVIDGVKADLQPLQEDILRHLACDMVFYRADSPRELAERQNAGWDKALDWALAALGADFQPGSGVVFRPQKPETLAAAAAYLRRLLAPQEPETAFALAALHSMTALTGSALLAFMAEAAALPAETVWQLAHIEEDWTAEHWGIDAEAAARRAARARDFFAAAAVAAALRPLPRG